MTVRSLVSKQLMLMKPGDAVTFTRPNRKLPAPGAGNAVSMLIGSYLTRRRPGCTFTQESFITFTYAGNAYAGVIVTLVSESEAKEPPQ